MSLLFCSYVLFAPGEPAASYFAHRQPSALIPYIPRTLACCKASQFRLPSDATRTAFELFLWSHPSTQNGHTRHLMATKVGAVVFATSEQESSECGRRMEPDAHGCRSSHRAGRCCVHRLGRGRGGRREGERAGQVGRAVPAANSSLLPSPFDPSGSAPADAPLPLALLPLLSSVTPPPLLAPLPPLLALCPPPAAALTACSLSCSTWAMAACMARPAS